MKERQATYPVLMNSGSVLKSPLLDQVATGAGDSVTVPFLKDITDQTDEVQVENTAPTTDNGQPSGLMKAPVLNRVCKNSATALSGQVSGADPVGSITGAMAQRRLKQRQSTLLAMLRGIFGSAGATGTTGCMNALRVEKFIENGTSAAAANLMSVDTFLDAKALMGELADTLADGALFIHPNVLAGLEKADVTAFKEKSMGNWTIKTYRGVPIFVTEALVRAGATNGYVYDTYLLANGIVGYGEKPQAGDTIDVASLQLNMDKGKNNWEIYDRTRWLAAINGIKWVGTPAGQSATNTELQAVANWQLVFQTANRVGALCIRTNG
jgi:hypothetical protein